MRRCIGYGASFWLALLAAVQASTLYVDIAWQKSLSQDLHFIGQDLISVGSVAAQIPALIENGNVTIWNLEGTTADGFIGSFLLENSTISSAPKLSVTCGINLIMSNGKLHSKVSASTSDGTLVSISHRSRRMTNDRIVLYVSLTDAPVNLQEYGYNGNAKSREHVIKIRYPDSLLNVANPSVPADKSFTLHFLDIPFSYSFMVNAATTEFESGMPLIGEVSALAEDFMDDASNSVVAGVQLTLFFEEYYRIHVTPDFTPTHDWYIVNDAKSDRMFWMQHTLRLEGLNGEDLPTAGTLVLEISVVGTSLCTIPGISIAMTSVQLETALSGCASLSSPVAFEVVVDDTTFPVARDIKVYLSEEIGISAHVEQNSENFKIVHTGLEESEIENLGKDHQIEVYTVNSQLLPTGNNLQLFVDIPGEGERAAVVSSSTISAASLASNVDAVYSDKGLVSSIGRWTKSDDSGFVFHIVFNKKVILRSQMSGVMSNVVLNQQLMDPELREGSKHEWMVRSSFGGAPSGSVQLNYKVTLVGSGETTFQAAADAVGSSILSQITGYFGGAASGVSLERLVGPEDMYIYRLSSPSDVIGLQVGSTSPNVIVRHDVVSAFPTTSSHDNLLVTLTNLDTSVTPTVGEFRLLVQKIIGGNTHEVDVLSPVTVTASALQSSVNTALSGFGTSATVGDVVTLDADKRLINIDFSGATDVSVTMYSGSTFTSVAASVYIPPVPVSFHLMINSGVLGLLTSGTVHITINIPQVSPAKSVSFSVTASESSIQNAIDSKINPHGLFCTVTPVSTSVTGQRKIGVVFSDTVSASASLTGGGLFGSVSLVQI